jgi:RNA polymerase sigma factor (sigma-70 family)
MRDDPFLDALWAGHLEDAWSLFVDRYRRLIISVARHYTRDPDEVMDLFAHICGQLRAHDLARLKRYADDRAPRASFSTWLVVVMRRLVADWFRARDGRSRDRVPDGLSPLGQRIHDYLFVRGHSQRETYELVIGASETAGTRAEYQQALREVHRAVFSGQAPAPTRTIPVERLVAVPADVAIDLDLTMPLVQEDVTRLLNDAMQALEPDVRLAIQLFVVEEVAAQDVARALGWPNAKAVYNKVYRALDAIRERLADRGLGREDL